ncbi:uncharacterized protein LOC108700791 [Xenopus laevis]|uniref:Uncharacterized protein LOC108700791 n=2 Tax=Xenopus laevis TaxID=8355 RepID=A0A1L8ES22_XENLA|nr:uncharacterized protein LOC108700791 [Xenopus laevis]OCT62121.1 hypothetical protein XELAEV_18043205mg [Xenopus laevis]
MMEPPAGYEEVAGTKLGYLRVGGRQLFALAQVLSGPLRGVPRGRVCRRMERLRIQIRRCDLWELRALKALRSVPSRAVQCCLISLEDLHVLCASSWGPKTVTPADEIGQNGRPEKERLPSRIKATFPSGLASLFPGTSRNLSTGHSPASSLGYSSPSDSNPEQISSSDTESDDSEASVQNVRYRAPKIPTKRKSAVPRGRGREVRLHCRTAEAESFSVCDPEVEGEWPVAQNNGPNQVLEEARDSHKGKVQDESPAEIKETCEVEENSPKSEEPPPAALDAPGSDGQPPDVEPRTLQFDRLVRQSKLWCYARGFRTDMRDLHPRVSHKGKGASGARKNGKLRHRKRNGKADGKIPVHCNKRLNSGPSHPARPPFRFLDNFPSPASLVVGEDGDLCPAYSLKATEPSTLPRSHPLWDWHPGGTAIPLPPSLKFRTFPWGDCE